MGAFEESTEWKERGNLYMSNKEYKRATIAYRAGVQLLEKEHQAPQEQQRQRQEYDAVAADSKQMDDRHLDLYVRLLNNCALSLLKMESFQDAEQCCNKAVAAVSGRRHRNRNSSTSSSADVGKALYRRAQSRHSMYLANNVRDSSDRENNCKNATIRPKNYQNENEKLLIAGIDDIQRAIEIYDNNGETKSQKECQIFLDIMEAEFNKVQERKLQTVIKDKDSQNADEEWTATRTSSTTMARPKTRTSPAKSSASFSTGMPSMSGGQNKQTPPSSPSKLSKPTLPSGTPASVGPPSPSKQKEDILNILKTNQRALSAQKNGNTASPAEELYCLVEWTWWSRWCHLVDFFELTGRISDGGEETNELEGSQKVSRATKRILTLLPPGAHLAEDGNNKSSKKKPSATCSTRSDDDSDEDDDSSTSSNHLPEELGPIDNTCLLLGQDKFSEQWYRRPIASEGYSGGRLSSQPHQDPLLLKPNLVRGYHYEVLPREIYNALRIWYGEVIPPICRRKTRHQTIVLYPHQNEAVRSRGALVIPLMAPSGGRNGISRCSACLAPDNPNKKCRNCRGASYCDKKCQTSHWPYHKQFCNQLKGERTDIDEGRDGNFDESAISASLPFGSNGRVGLSNLGNTCFMASALQSLSHATPLTRFFLSGNFEEDVNPDNPLGTNGKLAHAYGKVMKELWMKPDVSSFSPSALKRAVAAFAPRFAGYQQHDAQEFLAYLLDGLHEDLNRVKKAPYVEMPDVTDGHDLAIAGAEAWDAHKKRNDSLVLDSFYGQFQSTCVCPRCNRVSVSFDAFNHISLEIPQGKVTINVLLHRYEGGLTAYAVKASARSTLNDVKLIFAEMVNIQASDLFLFDAAENETTLNSFIDTKRAVSTLKGISEGRAYLLAYQAHDSNRNDVMHMIIANTYVVINPECKREEQKESIGEDTGEEYASFDKKTVPIPIMTSLEAANCTARDVWNHIWKLVRHTVVPVHEPEERDANSVLEFDHNTCKPSDFLTVNLLKYSGHGRMPNCVFPLAGAENEKSSAIPPDSDILLTEVLGEDFATQYLFLELEWKNPPSRDGERTPFRVDTDKLHEYDEDESILEAMKEDQRRNGLRGVTLYECFRSFSNPERLDSQNTWYCSNCKDHVRALKTMKLWRLPNILIVHLKRFEFRSFFRRDKLDTLVDFPLEGLKMDQYCAHVTGNEVQFVDDYVPAEYDLFAVVNHYGRMGFGHYTAFARSWDETGVSRQWNLFDDSRVTPVGEPREMVNPAAYILFYRRRQFN